MAKRRLKICETLQAVSAVMAILGVIEVKYDGARQLKWFKMPAVWHNVIFWPLPPSKIFFQARPPRQLHPTVMRWAHLRPANKIAGARSSATMRVACVVLATLALLASSSFALDDAADAAAPSPAGNPGASADAAGGFPTTTDVNLMRWISEKGGAFAGVGVYSFVASSDDSDVADARYGSRAMYAKEAEVPNGAEVFRLPSSAVIIAHSEAAGSACLNRLASLDPEWALAAMILRERSARHASPHAAFIDAMYAHPPPGARVGKMPRGSDADAALRETRAGHLLAGWRDDYARGWLALDTLCVRKRPTEFSAEYFNPRAFEEALAMVHAASVRIPVDDLRRDDESRERRAKDGAKTATRAETSRLAAALVPIAHLMPHDPRGTAPCVTVHEDGATLVVKAAAGAPGTELACNRAPPRDSRANSNVETKHSRETVGRMTDAEALARFGTVGPGRNRGDRLALSLPADSLLRDATGDAKSDAAADRRRRMMDGCGDPAEYAFAADGPTLELTCAVRVATATDAEIDALAARHDAAAGDTSVLSVTGMVSEDSEAAALASLYETAAAILDAYPTSDAEDEAILRRGLAGEDEGAVEGAVEGAEGAGRLAVTGETREAVRCRLREKLLVVDALNALRRAAETRLKGKVPFELRADFGEMADEGKRREGVEVSPPEGFEARKAHYKSDEL